MSETINEMFRRVICLNEGGESVAYKFSDPDGVRSGKSGWSFGVSQFDTRNNDQALVCLKECGFTVNEIHGIVDQTIDVRPFAARLAAHADIIEKYDLAQLHHCLNSAGQFGEKYGIPISDSACLLSLGDTINQYGSLGSGSAAHLMALNRPVTNEDVLTMKLEWKYSQTKSGRADTVRRAGNVVKVANQ